MPHRPLPALLAAACAAEPACPLPIPEPVEQANVLVLIVDDVGIDQLSAYGVGADPVDTPTLDCLCREGVRFDRAWAAPLCTPARIALLSGRHPRRESIGHYLNVTRDTWELPLRRQTLAEAVEASGTAAGMVGKWHIGAFEAPSGVEHPVAQGFTRFSGTLGNPAHGMLPGFGGGSYFAWEHLVGASPVRREGYLTSATVHDGLVG